MYLVARLARGDFGLGDVKLSFLLGLFTAYQGWAELAVGFVGGPCGGVHLGLSRFQKRRARLKPL